ncbi:MAG TPA: GNAT family N-acetyltransferase [Anaerolineales bacterium]|nr:GNAT family N-acetyltransferase [Anaerolineales bacterium]
MSDNNKVLVRNARDQDIPAVVEIDKEAFSPYGTAEQPETFQLRLRAFPDGFIILVAENEVAAYGCSEKWLTEREPALDENPLETHQPDGRILCITGMAVKKKYQGRGYGVRLLDKFLEIAHGERCQKIILDTTHAQSFFHKRGFETVQHRRERGVSLDIMSIDVESHRKK